MTHDSSNNSEPEPTENPGIAKQNRTLENMLVEALADKASEVTPEVPANPRRSKAKILATTFVVGFVFLAGAGLAVALSKDNSKESEAAKSNPTKTTTTERSTTTATSQTGATESWALLSGPDFLNGGGSGAVWGDRIVVQDAQCDDNLSRNVGAYNATTGIWERLGSVPGEPRESSLLVARETSVYMVGGFEPDTNRWTNASSVYKNEAWEQIAPFPVAVRIEKEFGVWTGNELIVVLYGAEESAADKGPAGSDFSRKNFMATYYPKTDSWIRQSDPILDTANALDFAWTGSELLVYGSHEDSRNAQLRSYNPEDGRWALLADSPLAPRRELAIQWTGSELVVTGGLNLTQTEGTYTYLKTGAKYKPTQNRWEDIALSPLSQSFEGSSVWTGSQFLIIGGTLEPGDHEDESGAAYDPGHDTWKALRASPGVMIEGEGGEKYFQQITDGGGQLFVVEGKVIALAPLGCESNTAGYIYTPARP